MRIERLVHLLLRLLVVAGLSGCGDDPPRFPDTLPPADTAPADTRVAPDTTPPAVCRGSVPSCAERTPENCTSVIGCDLGTCEPGISSRSCSLRFDSFECNALAGCSWDEDCEGTATPCSSFQDEMRCREQICAWSRFGEAEVCRGSSRPCEALTVAECIMQPGCTPIEPVDASIPDAAADTGDAAVPTCGATGTCHPITDAACACGLSSTDGSWGCGEAGVGHSGETCVTTSDCAAGLHCTLRSPDGAGVCRSFCEADTDCAAAEGCVFVGLLPSAYCLGYCLPIAQCSLRAQDCPLGADACYWLSDSGRDYSFCNPAGTSGRVGCADDPTACPRGAICVTDPGPPRRSTCRSLCTTAGVCTGGTPFCTGVAADAMYCEP